jgi:diacylglycerol O-acyltransferase
MRNLADYAGLTTLSGVATQARGALKAVATRLSGQAPDPGRSIQLPLTPAPPTPWNLRITPHRRFAMRSASLANIKQLKNAIDGTVNDVVMAVCTGALRKYLLRHDALPDRPLRAMVPVSIRTGDEDDVWTNRVSAIVADLPTDCADPLERVARCREAMAAAKRQFELVPATTLIDASQTTSPIVAAAALRLVSGLRLADRINLPFNLTLSNVPGPRETLYFAGAQLDHYIPISIVTDDVGLNITVHSCGDELDFGLVADRELIPDLWELADLHIDEVARLFEATGAEWATPQRPPAFRVHPS